MLFCFTVKGELSQLVLISDFDTRLSQVGLELTMKLMLVSNLELALLLPQPPSPGITLFCFEHIYYVPLYEL